MQANEELISVGRTIVRLRPDQVAALSELAARQCMSVSELVRQGVDRMIAEGRRAERIARFLSLSGCVGGPSDMGVRHDDYLYEAYSANLGD